MAENTKKEGGCKTNESSRYENEKAPKHLQQQPWLKGKKGGELGEGVKGKRAGVAIIKTNTPKAPTAGTIEGKKHWL